MQHSSVGGTLPNYPATGWCKTKTFHSAAVSAAVQFSNKMATFEQFRQLRNKLRLVIATLLLG